MKRIILCLLALSVFKVNAASLNLPDGVDAQSVTVTTTVTDASTGVTFDVTYTVTASVASPVAGSENPTVFSLAGGSTFGVGTDGDVNDSQRGTLDGEREEQLTFSALTVSNISSPVSFSIENLRYTGLTISFGNNTQDGFLITENGVSQTFGRLGSSPGDLPFDTAVSEFLFENDSAQDGNRFNISGIAFSFDVVPVIIPEPSTAALLGLAGLALLARRSKKK